MSTADIAERLINNSRGWYMAMEQWLTSLGFDVTFGTSVVLRLLTAAVLSGILGFERTRKLRAAGLRTYILVCVGSAMAMITGLHASELSNHVDPTRIAAQVLSGVGFIGAGTIMITGYHRVRGITTAAGLWVSACLGLAVGIGMYAGSFAMLIITLSSVIIGEKVQTRYIARSNLMRLYILFEDAEYLRSFLAFLKSENISIRDFEQPYIVGKSFAATFILKVAANQKHIDIVGKISAHDGIAYAEEV